MRTVEPRVFLVGQALVCAGLDSYLEHVGAYDSDDVGNELWSTDAPSGNEELVEVMGRLCYRSWKPGMNANVTKVREGNDNYIANIVRSKHGAVLEHTFSSWIFADVSRVFTHELVRHRAGTAFSQESLRYVRLTDLGLWLPPEVAHHSREVVQLFEEAFESAEQLQLRLAEVLRLDEMKDFSEKKKMTSAMRRVAPIGLATSIGFSCNLRALRHLLSLRTADSAETEIRLVFDEVGRIAKETWPNIFFDFERDDDGCWRTVNEKV